MNKALNIFLPFSIVPLIFQAPATAITLEFTPNSQTTTLNSQISVDLAISGLGAGTEPSLGAFDISLGFDSSVIAFDNAVFGDQLDLLGIGSINGTDITIFPPEINLFEISLNSVEALNDLQADSFTLATVTFDAVGIGTSSLTFNDVTLADAFGLPLDADLQPGLITVERGTTMAFVPESSTSFPLLVSGKIGILIWLFQKKLVQKH